MYNHFIKLPSRDGQYNKRYKTLSGGEVKKTLSSFPLGLVQNDNFKTPL